MRAAILRQISENGLDPKVAHVSVDGKLRPKDSFEQVVEFAEDEPKKGSHDQQKELKEEAVSEETSTADTVTEDLQQKDIKKKGGFFKKKPTAQ